ncbi:hypothetical protein DSO57_1007144 [Entomophthora muscae]|uniref:Uncharacterized protein n=1 Tax=Entomophthora muscae TaxID=34485 RepID=A0ACC2T7E6_9FUNG|nr:hypothetical protein DSO57_1007144 [Entomophthora muscae]
MKLCIVTLIFGLSIAYDSSEVHWLDLPCQKWLGGGCANWMRCLDRGRFNATSTSKACVSGGFEDKGGKCWSRKLRGRVFKGNKSCNHFGRVLCPVTAANYYSCSKD